jgi:hypothetical protein
LELGALLARTVTPEQGNAVLAIVSAMAREHTRGRGFTAGVPNEGIRAVILTASARLLFNSTGLLYDEVHGPDSVSYRSAFNGWTLVERIVLDRYRVTAI